MKTNGYRIFAGEENARLRKGTHRGRTRKPALRLLSATLSLSMLFTGCGPASITPVTIPNGVEQIESALQDGGDYGASERADAIITGFESLSEDIREQTVPLGTAMGDLILPDTLEASVVVKTPENEGGGVKPPKEDEDPDDDDKDSEDKDPDDKEKEDGDKTPGEGDEKDDGTQDGDNGSGDGDNDGSGENGGTGSGENGGSGDGENDSTGDGDNGGTGGGENDSTGDGENDSTDGSSADGQNNAISTESGSDGGAASGDGDTTGTDGEAPEASDSASGKASAGFSVETGSFIMPSYASENPQDGVKAGTLTDSTDGTAAAPADDTAAQADTDTREKTVTIEDITWESAPSYDGDTEGVYTFTPVLPEGYAVSEGVSLPQITVTVAEDDTQAEELRVLMELLRALPDPEEYLTYDEAADAVIEHEDMIDEEQLEEAREAADAYLDRYPDAETADSADTDDADTDSVSLAALLARLEGLEHIRDTVADCMDTDCPYHYPQFVQERMAQDETPELLTLEDLVEDYGVEEPVTPAAQTYGGRARAAAYAAPTLHPQTLMVTADNEDNAHTGTADGDIDETMSAGSSSHPIEISFTLDELPTQSAYLAVKAYDVDEEFGEHDYVYLNGDIYKSMDLKDSFGKGYNSETVGYLSGTNATWNTTVLEIPLKKLVKGKNVISVTVAPGWVVKVDWMQLVLDGGGADPNIETFALKITDAVTEGGNVTIHSDVTIRQKGTIQYATEYTLTQEATGDALDACFGSASATETVGLTMPLDSPTGIYRITGILKNPDTEEIKAVDNISFRFIQGVGMGAKTTHTLTPDTLTNQSVTIKVSAEATEGVTDVTVTPNTRTVTTNGTYNFKVEYRMNGTRYSYNYPVKVDNIDKEPPFIGFSAITVTESMTQQQFEQLFKEALTVTDNVTKECKVTYTLPKVADVRAAGGGKVTVTAQDEVGNKATLDCVLIVTSPFAFSKPTAVRQGTTKTFTLTAKLTAIGRKAVTESGFVWGIMPNPSVTYNQGSAKTASPVTKAGVNFSVKTTEIVEGMTYYARAYAKVGDVCYYSDAVPFDIGAKQCGVFTIASNGYGKFTVTRTGGTEGAQTVYYRTVNGTAVGGTHFTHQASTLTFKEGETTKTITVTEKNATNTYGGRTATAYSNADRTYQVELYRVTGGGTLGSTTRATRTMHQDLNYHISKTMYEPVTFYNVKNEYSLWDDRGSCHKYEITDGGSGETNGKNNGINWYNGRTNHKGHKSDPFNLPRYHHGMYVGKKEYFLDSKNPSDGWCFRYEMTETQIENGWGHLWVGTAPAPTGKQTVSDKNGASPFNGGSQKWAGFFETGYSAGSTIHVPGTPRDHGNEIWASRENGSIYTYGGQKYIMFDVDETAYMHFAANGPKDDVWRIDSITEIQLLIDTKEPQLLGVAPMAGGAYKQGDEVTISLVFDEIVDSANSNKAGGLSGLVAKTNWGDFTYVGGADTNVLIFKGTVPANASGKITVNSITNADRIKDLCDHAGGTVSAGTGSTSVTVDTKQPTVAITNTSLTNGTASGRITATNADTLQYAWSQDTTMPAAGWFTCKSGETVTTRQASGKWYLHALATYEGTGASAYQCSSAFDFGTPESPKFPLPELSVTAVNSSWTNQNRTITITKKPAGASLEVTKPDGTTQTLSNNATTYAAPENGVYTFVLTSNGETVAKDAVVEKIDKVKPDATLTEAGGTDAIYHKLTMTAKAADADSGVARVEYAFTTSASAPTSGWTTAGDSDKLADGRYKLEYTATETSQTTRYLHVKVTDNAGNTFTASSKGYKVVKEPAAGAKPAITLTAASTAWTNGDVTLTWTVTNGGAGDCTVHVGDEMLTGKTTGSTGTFKVQKNGIYMVSLTDANGDSASATVVVNNIDKEAPEMDSMTVSPEGWATSKKVYVTDYRESDNLTLQYDEKGVTGKSGSGVTDRAYYKPNSDSLYGLSNSPYFPADRNGTYRVSQKDRAGNVSYHDVEVTGIDTVKPTVTATVSNTPKTSGWYTDSTVSVTLSYADKEDGSAAYGDVNYGPASGIKSVQYAFVNPATPTDAPTTPASFTSLGSQAVAKGSATCNLTQNGIWYLYCKVTDKAGNETAGWMKADGSLTASAGEAAPIKKDSNKGSGTITGQSASAAATTGLTIYFDLYYGPSGGKKTLSGNDSLVRFQEDSRPDTRTSKGSYSSIRATGTNYIYYEPNSWGTKYYWTFYIRKVTFDSQGGSTVEPHLVWTTQSSASTSTVVDCKLAKPADPTRTGYDFIGWYTDAACTKEFDFANQTQIRTDMTLYAKWEAIKYNVAYYLQVPQTVTSSYDEYSEAAYAAPADKTTYTYGQKMELPVPTLALGVNGFTFDGWYTNDNYTGTRYTSIPETKTGNMAYYARYLDTQAPPEGHGQVSADRNMIWDDNMYYYRDIGTLYVSYSYGSAYKTENENRQIEKFEVWRDGVSLGTKENTSKNKRVSAFYLQGRPNSSVSSANYIIEGDHTYQVQATDTAGNKSAVHSERIFYDKTQPKGPEDVSDITYSTEPVTWYTNGSSIKKENFSGANPIKVFSEVPTISIPVQDKPGDGANASSGLWKVTYKLTTLNKRNGNLDNSSTDILNTDIFLTDLGTDGVAKITLPSDDKYKNWRGKITDIKLYDKAGNITDLPDIEEMLVDTTPPRIGSDTYGTIYLGERSGAYRESLQDKWYAMTDFEQTGEHGQLNSLYSSIIDDCSIESYRWLVNGAETADTYKVNDGNYVGRYSIWLNLISGSNLKFLGANTFTLEVTDYAGRTATASVTLKIGGDPSNPVAEQTPAAICDYPADAIAQLAPNAQYAITSGGTTYNVTTDAQGRIPFVLPASVAGGTEVDLCGQNSTPNTISIVKKGVTEGGVERSGDSLAQENFKINPRPAAPNVGNDDITPELLQDADDAKINLTITDDSYTWEYRAGDSGNWKDAPAASGGKSTITNLPKGDILIRAKAKANTSAAANDGNPYGKTQTVTIQPGTGTITAKYNLNIGGSSTQHTQQTGLKYKDRLTEPAKPTRTGYDFMGWYQSKTEYQPGGSTDKAWRFDTQTVGEILGTDRSAYEGSYNSTTQTYDVTLYAGWRENVAPTVKPTLKTKTGADGSGQAEAAGEDRFYPKLFIDLSCYDNVSITKLSVSKDSGAYTEIPLTGTGTGTGVTGSGTTGDPYKLTYPVEEGVHTYTFKAQDAAGNETEPPETVTAKLDSVNPVFGEAKFEEGYKHLWDWIIKQKSLTITIPVTETGSGIASNGVTYTLTPAGGSAGESKNATVSGSADKGYTATIQIDATFKGTVTVNATDNAGNKADAMQIGADGSGIDGVLVESAAPVVTVLADRGTGDTTATATAAANGKEVETTAYYKTAPGLFVTVKDEDLTINGAKQTAAGLKSISWKIGDGAENPVGADYLGAPTDTNPKGAPLTSHSFTIGGLEGLTGKVTVTIKATDNAENVTEKTVTLHIKDKMALPAPSIDYINEKLTGLTAEKTYDIGGEEHTAAADGSIAIREEWFGSDLSLHAKTDNADTTLDSDDVQIKPAARPDVPEITKSNETIKGKGDGKLHDLTENMEYSTDDGKTWTAVQTTDAAQAGYATADGVMENLAAGVFLVRVKAKENTVAGANDGAPHGRSILAQIEEGTPLTVTFDTNGGSDLAPMTGLAWNDTVERPKDPAKDGYAVEGWYRDETLNNRWNFKDETDAHALNDTNGVKTDGDAPGITLYAKWKDDESPTLDAQLTAGTERAAADERSWYNSLAVVLTYSDNEEVTALYVKKDGEADYTEITGELGTENGKDESGNTRYQYTYDKIAEGEHTYTFKAADAAGKETETTVTAKLDTTKPAFGTASYEEGHKNLWDWIIKKDSLLITVPVTEIHSGVDTVAYTLIPAGNAAGAAEGDADGGTDSAADIITGTAKVTGSQSGGYQAKISVAADFKGSVKISGSDKAGNTADEKTIGTDGNGIKGVIVENNAPQITILADRLPSEPETTRPEGTTLLLGEDDYYDNAPGLVVQLADDGMGYGVTGDGVTGDGSLTTSGLASVKYQVGTNPEKTVEKDYHTAIVTQDSFTIPDTETMAPAGATSITVTVKATDQAGNTATRTVTVRLKSREATPQAGIGYVAEKLTGLRPNTVYIINDMNLETDAAGSVAINESWFDTDVAVVMPGNRSTTVNSTAQERNIPARPAAPALGAANASYPGAADGAITLTAPAQGAAYEISADGGKTWKNAALSGGKITGLAAGDYRVRVKAAEGKNFSSTPTEVKVEATPATPYDMPDAKIEYRLEALKGLEPGAVYELTTYGGPIEEDDEDDGSGDSGDGGSEDGGAGDGGGSAEDGTGDEEMPDPTVLTLTAGADGTIPIQEEWLGKGFYIVRKGNDKDKTMSPAQELNIPLRPDAPTPTGEDVSPANPAELAKLKDLAPNTAYDVSADGGKTWATRTTDGNGVIRGLDAPETYVARVSATDTNFKGKASGEVELGSFQLTVTFMANGEKHQEVKVYYGKKLTPVPTVPPKKDAGDQILAGEWCRDEDGNNPVDFSAEKITADLTVYACYSEGRLVTLRTGKGYALTPQEGSGSLTEQGNGSYSVKLGGSFTFQFALAEGYEKTDQFAVKVNGVAVELPADGTYTITNITENQTVTVEGVKKTGGNNGGGSSGGSHGGDDNGGNNGGDNNGGGTTPGGTNPGDNTKPGDGTKPGSGTKPGDNTKPGSGTKPGGSTKPGDNTKPGGGTNPSGNTKPGDGTKPGGNTKPGDSTKPGNGSNPSIGGEVPKISVTIKDGKIVIGGTGANGTDGGNGTGADGTDGGNGTGADGTDNGSGTNTDGTNGADGGIATGNVPGMTGAGTASQNGESAMSTMLQLGDGAIIVTVVCKGAHYTAGVADTVAVANAALTTEQIQLAAGGETIEIRVEVTDISESVPTQDKGVIEDGIEAYSGELPGLTLGMYIDISVFIRVGGGDWNAIRKTGEPIDVIIGIPEELKSEGRAYYIIRAHDGGYTLMKDKDDTPDTITISSDLFSSYAIAYIETDGTGADAKCGLCHICPTFLGICCFIWLAVILAVVVIVILVIMRRRKKEEEQEGRNG